MTRYQYQHAIEPTAYWVYLGEVYLGWCRREDDAGPSKRWSATIITDPFIIGTGRTRDDAVDDCYEQVGGPD